MIVRNSVWAWLSVVMLALVVGACANNEPGAGGSCTDADDCGDGYVCEDGFCTDDPMGNVRDISEPSSKDDSDLADYTESCDDDADCKGELSCMITPEGDAICTRRCPPDGGNDLCNEGEPENPMECLGIRPDAGDIVYVCMPRPQTQCRPCAREGDDLSGQCGTVGLDLCAAQPNGEFRCAINCGPDLPCPDGTECSAVPELDGNTYEVCIPTTGYCQKCVDNDGDGYGNPAYDMSECPVPNVEDCDDNDPNAYPGAPTSCDGIDNNCQGRADDEYKNEAGDYATLAHCGACNQACSLPNAVAECDSGVCNFVECEPGWLNLHGDADHVGCPYECTPRADKTEDRPDDLSDPSYDDENRDYNCDGIDGDVDRAYFVAQSGDDNNPGTPDKPFKTIGKALDILTVMSTEIDQIYVSQGTYAESLDLVDGISIYGGFDAGNHWERDRQHRVIISGSHNVDGNRIGLRGVDLDGSAPTVLQNIEVTTVNATGVITGTKHGAGSYGLLCKNCPSLQVRGAHISAGGGADGVGGDTGGRANATPPSTCKGGDGVMAGGGRPADGPPGGKGFLCSGYGGWQAAFTTNGGDGGSAANDMGGDGGDGEDASNMTKGGAGAPGVGPGCHSQADDGKDGKNGRTGQRGAGGKQPTTTSSAGFYIPTMGGDGHMGEAGAGGGGGGGGATHNASLPSRRHSGGPGGGGGAGGCPGAGGTAGGGGGASIALALIDSTGVQLQRITLQSSNAGNGAAGGAGGGGRAGCAGGRGETGADAKQCDREGGSGGQGGAGGSGGDGGQGGGGAGGSTIGLLLSGTTPATEAQVTTSLPTNAGSPGGTSTSRGQAGERKSRLSL